MDYERLPTGCPCRVPPVDEQQQEQRYELRQPTTATGPIREEPRPLGLTVGAGLVAAIVGGVVWGLVVKYSDYEIGIVAWGIGLLVGLAVAAVSRSRGPVLQAVAVACALVGILLGKYLSYALVLQEEADAQGVDIGLFSSEMWSFFREDLDLVFGWFDLLWIGLAVYTAWRALQPVEPELPPEPERPLE
jgi:hypothetical protein